RQRMSEIDYDLNSLIVNATPKRCEDIEQLYLDKSSSGDADEVHLALLYKSLAGDTAEVSIPSWVPIAGYVAGCGTFLFFMALVVASIFGHQVPHESRFLVGLLVAFGASLTASFI